MISRRDSLKWMMAAAALGAPAAAKGQVSGAVTGGFAPWPVLMLPPLTGAGYGTDPDTINPTAPWLLTLTASHRTLINTLGNWLLPADDVSKGAGDGDIAAFFDEWISAPYPDQQEDRIKLLALLLWIDAQSRLMSDTDFFHSSTTAQQQLIEMLLAEPTPDGLSVAAGGFIWFRVMTIFGYYSMPDNLAAAGMEREDPIVGDYPGPTKAAMQHLNGLLTSLNLTPYS